MVLQTWIWGSLALGIGYLPKGNDGELDPQNRIPKLGPEVGPTIRALNWAHNLGPRAQIPGPWAQKKLIPVGPRGVPIQLPIHPLGGSSQGETQIRGFGQEKNNIPSWEAKYCCQTG